MLSDSERIVLLDEWIALLKKQRAIIEQREEAGPGHGLLGILVCNDPLALQYQALQSQIWDIKWKLFGSFQIAA